MAISGVSPFSSTPFMFHRCLHVEWDDEDIERCMCLLRVKFPLMQGLQATVLGMCVNVSAPVRLDVHHLNRWWCHLVNAYEVRQAWCLLQVKLCDPCLSTLKWCSSCKALYKCSAFFYQCSLCCQWEPLNVGDHWITATNVLSDHDNEVQIFDSMFRDINESTVVPCTSLLYRHESSDTITFSLWHSGQQTIDTRICGRLQPRCVTAWMSVHTNMMRTS